MSSAVAEVRPSGNRLLLALPERDRKRLLSGSEQASFALSDVVHRRGDVIRSVYFPSDALISLVSFVGVGVGAEVGLIGPEGMTGVSALLGSAVSAQCVVCQGAGAATRIDARKLQQEFARAGVFQRLVYLHVEFAFAQLSHVAACNSFHPIEARLARWMLMVHDRLHSVEFRITQEFLAQMLGVRREAVSAAARALQEQNLLDYRRGRVTLLDCTGLLARSCLCYGEIKAEYDALITRFSEVAASHDLKGRVVSRSKGRGKNIGWQA